MIEKLPELAAQVIEIGRKASLAIMKIYAQTDHGTEYKSDASPVTAADKASDRIIREGLSDLESVFPIISEETPIEDYDTRKQYETYWLVDPLDGTKEFVQRNGEFAINIALMHHNEPILGVVIVPILDDEYWAAKGAGAWRNSIRIQADTFTMQQSGLCLAVSRSHFNQATADFVGGFTYPRLVARGSALKMLMIATGEAHLHPRFGPTMEWDTAAPQIIVTEAGGSIRRMEDQKSLDYNKEDLTNPNFLVLGSCR
jgi:3'(2'), 5'-bisphosphate nucleotidase